MSYMKKICCVFYLFLGVITIFHESVGATAAVCANTTYGGCNPGYGCINVAMHGATHYACVAGAANGACPAGSDWVNIAGNNAVPAYACTSGVSNHCPHGQTPIATPVVQSGQIVGNTYRCENICDPSKFPIPNHSTNLRGQRTYCTGWGMRGWDIASMLTVASSLGSGQPWGPDQKLHISCDANGAPINCTFRAQTHNCNENNTCPCVLHCD
jgi:hypothetical protein